MWEQTKTGFYKSVQRQVLFWFPVLFSQPGLCPCIVHSYLPNREQQPTLHFHTICALIGQQSYSQKSSGNRSELPVFSPTRGQVTQTVRILTKLVNRLRLSAQLTKNWCGGEKQICWFLNHTRRFRVLCLGIFFNFLRTAERVLGFLQSVVSFRKRWGVQLTLQRLISEFSTGKWVMGKGLERQMCQKLLNFSENILCFFL